MGFLGLLYPRYVICRVCTFSVRSDSRIDHRLNRGALSEWETLLMSTTLASIVTPLLGDYVYVGGGVLTLVIVILVVLFLLRRA